MYVNLVARLGEGLRGDHPQQPDALREQREKTVELGLIASAGGLLLVGHPPDS